MSKRDYTVKPVEKAVNSSIRIWFGRTENRRQYRNGFSLLELTMVLLIMGIAFFALAAGYRRSLDYIAFVSVKNRLLSILEECNAEFLIHQRSCLVSVSDSNLSIQKNGDLRTEALVRKTFMPAKSRVRIQFSNTAGSTGQIGSFKGTTILVCVGSFAEKIVVAANSGRISFRQAEKCL